MTPRERAVVAVAYWSSVCKTVREMDSHAAESALQLEQLRQTIEREIRATEDRCQPEALKKQIEALQSALERIKNSAQSGLPDDKPSTRASKLSFCGDLAEDALRIDAIRR